MDKKIKIEEAVALKESGNYNCAQAVACAFAAEAGMDAETLRRLTGAFGSGFGCTRGTCGALTGAGVILGLNIEKRAEAAAAMRAIMDKFEAQNGSTVCRALKGLDTGTPLRSCNDCVADAAGMLADSLSAMGL